MKRHCLIIGLTLIALTLVLAHIAYAETVLSATYASPGKGYDAGVGARIEHSQYICNVELTGTGKVAHHPKRGAERGYTWGIAAGVAYHLQSIYAGGGINYSGYKSRFSSGTVWQKNFCIPYLLAGYKSGPWDFSARYYPKESQTPNHTEHAAIRVEYSGLAPMRLDAEWVHTWFDQGGSRENDGVLTLSIGWVFE